MDNRDFISGRYKKVNRKAEIAKGIFQLLIAGALLIGLFYASDYAIRKQEVIDCEKYARWYGEYNLFKIDNETRTECARIGVKLPGEKEIIPDREYESVSATIYAYNSEVEQTDDDPLTMASGKKVYDGAIACPTKYAFGTKVEYQGRFYTCEDRMNKRYRDGNNFDIWMPTIIQAKDFGVRKETIKIYK